MACCHYCSGTIGLFLYEIQSSSVDTARTIAVNVLVAFQIYYLWAMQLAQYKTDSGIKPYIPLMISTAAILVLQSLFIYTPWMQGIFATTALSLDDWLKINAVAFTIMA